MNDSLKIVFCAHVNQKGKIVEAKEKFECQNCGGECYETYSSVSPSLVQSFEFKCTDCLKEWKESY